MAPEFTPFHRGGAGSPLVLLHGFMDTWRSWELVLPALEGRHDVLALTLPGHAGGPPFDGSAGTVGFVDSVERALDDAGFDVAHIAGNSLGGYVALQLAARDRALSVVGFAPAGGWAKGDASVGELYDRQRDLYAASAAAAAHADEIAATPEGRRRAIGLIVSNSDHIPAELVAHEIRGVAACDGAEQLLQLAQTEDWSLDAERIRCPVRIAWGTDDRLLMWPSAATRYQHDWLPNADWVILDGVGHCPQLDVPVEAAQLILGFTGP